MMFLLMNDVVLAMLELSAAFDTSDHTILLGRLKFGFCNTEMFFNILLLEHSLLLLATQHLAVGG